MRTETVGPDRDTKAEKIRDRAETHLIDTEEPKEGSGNPNWGDFRQYILDDIIDGGYGKDSARIKDVLENTEIRPLKSRSKGDDEDTEERDKKEEQWYSAQLYGALYNEFDSPDESRSGLKPTSFEVFREHDRWGLAVDLFVRNNRTDDFHLIEVKRAQNVQDLEDIRGQLKRYQAVFAEGDKTFLCLLYNDPDEVIALAEKQENTNFGTRMDLDQATKSIHEFMQREVDDFEFVDSEIDMDPN